MKSIVLKFLAFALTLSLVACGEAKQEEQNDTKGTVTSLELPDNSSEKTLIEGEDNPIEAKGNLPVFSFESDSYDFGKIEQGEKINHTFTFTNIGNAPLIISNIKTTCGCTTPTWTKEPVLAGETGTIEVNFNSAGKSNKQTKPITIFSNAGEAVVVTLTGFVNANKSNGPFKK